MAKNKIKFTFAAILCLVLLLMPILGINAHAEGIDDVERTQNDEPSLVVINPADDMPDSNADDSPDVVVDEDTPLGDKVDKTDNATNGGNIWLIVGISASAIAVIAIVFVFIAKAKRNG